MDSILSEELKRKLFSLEKGNITVQQISELFAYRTKKGNTFDVIPPVISTKAKIFLKAGEYINQEDITTTAGIFLFNKLLVEGPVSSVIPGGYYNEVLTKKKLTQFLDLLAQGILEGKLKIEPDIYQFLKDYEFWGLKLVTIFSPSYTMGMVKPSEELQKKRQKLLHDAPKDMSVSEMVALRDKILADVKDEIKNDPGLSLFDSGARGGFDNDFGNMFVAVGPVEIPGTGKFDFMKSNYINGIAKSDLVAAANIIVNAEYPKAIGTAQGGYIGKQFNATFQNITVGPEKSDCGTKSALTVTINKDDLFLYHDQFLIGDNGKLIEITSELDNKYLNKPVKIRSPMHCKHVENDSICYYCAGTRFYKIDIPNMGLIATNVSAQLLNASLKNRHSLLVQMNTINVNSLVL